MVLTKAHLEQLLGNLDQFSSPEEILELLKERDARGAEAMEALCSLKDEAREIYSACFPEEEVESGADFQSLALAALVRQAVAAECSRIGVLDEGRGGCDVLADGPRSVRIVDEAVNERVNPLLLLPKLRELPGGLAAHIRHSGLELTTTPEQAAYERFWEVVSEAQEMEGVEA